MEKTNVITADPVNSGYSVAIGEAKSKGVEVRAVGRAARRNSGSSCRMPIRTPSPRTSVLDPDFRKVVAEGDPLINIPEHNANVLLFKDFDIGGRHADLRRRREIFQRASRRDGHRLLPAQTTRSVRLLASYEVTDNLTISERSPT